MKALVTGGGGFLGTAIVRRLVQRGDTVRSFTRQHYPHLEPLGIEQFQGDIADADAVVRAAAGCDIVFHVAAKAGIWGPLIEYQRINVTGTENVLAACRTHGIGRLVYTSSPSVVFDGHDMAGGDESAPYPQRYDAHYPQTKAIAERMVLAANNPALATVALRPHLIWGPGDNHLIPRLLARARAGKLAQIGRERKLVDTVYIDNAADAHLAAADRLAPEAACAGKPYFIAQNEPVPLWDFIDRVLKGAGLPPVKRVVPVRAAIALGAALETTHRMLRLKGEPRMTRFLARQLSTAHWFDLTAARRDLGYAPAVSLDEGLRRLAESFRSVSEA